MDSDNNITKYHGVYCIFAVLNKTLSYYLNAFKNLALALFLVVFVSNLNSNSFTKDFQHADLVCEVDVDADEVNEESSAGFFSSLPLDFGYVATLDPMGGLGVFLPSNVERSKSYSLFFHRKRSVVLHNLKLFC
jgi:hypothetical protein